MLTNIKHFFIILFFFFVISQFIRPEKNKGSYDAITAFEETTKVSPEIKTILETQCYDCHTNVTRYPWYMEVSPITHYMGYHIEEGKEHFNISKWKSYTPEKQDDKLGELIEEIEKKRMPLKPYTWIHGGVSGKDAEKLIQWAKNARANTKVVLDTLEVQLDSTTIDSVQIDSLQVAQ